MIIDLTNTGKYYSSQQLSGIKCYSKMACPGFDGPPTVVQVNSFIELCRTFFELNPDAFVGVHCTHGFNRTGFMIISYLCECCDMELDTAIHAFANARPPGIYKQTYLDELIKRYDYDGVIVAPPLPSWSIEPDDNKQQSINKKEDCIKVLSSVRLETKKPLYSERKTTFMEGVGGVTPVYDPSASKFILQKIRDLMKTKKFGFIGCQPVTMSHENLHFISSRPYLVSWKADGTRYIIFIQNKDLVYLVDRDNALYKVNYLNFPKNKTAHLFDTLVDGEMVIDIYKNEKFPRYLIYDIMTFNGEYVGNNQFKGRLQLIDTIIKGRLDNISAEQKSLESFGIRSKMFFPLKMTIELWSGKFRQELSHEMDGLVFQPNGVNDFYIIGTCSSVLKWKPPNLNSIDFILKKEEMFDDRDFNRNPRYVGNLYVTGLSQPFARIEDSRMDLINSYDNAIVECTLNLCTNQWEVLRVRTDKVKPNYITTAESIYQNIIHPVDLGDLKRAAEHARR